MKSLLPRLALFAAAILLAGCAAITTKVTRFNAWPADAAGATFAFKPPEGREADLAQQTYEARIAGELAKLGLQPAAAGRPARFTVEVITGTGTKTRMVLEPVYSNQLVYVPPWRDRWGNVYPGSYLPDAWGSRYIGDREVARTLNVSELKLRITDQQGTPRPVFDGTAVYEGVNEDLPDLMPFLSAAVFQDFPGASGQVRLLRFDPKTGALITR
jgi:hypothetical protein